MVTSVIVPTFRRPDDLARCLLALGNQERKADQILAVARRSDEPSRNVIALLIGQIPGLEEVIVEEPGAVPAQQAGLGAVSPAADVVFLTDDDAAPRPDWISRVVVHFEANAKLAGVGGRDWMVYSDEGKDPETAVVGRVQWFGRTIGCHHRGMGPPRIVEILKGVNCAFRAGPLKEIGFDRRLRGAGAQIHWEMSLCFSLMRRGWMLLYDPAIGVDHYSAPRGDADVNNRGGFHAQSLSDIIFNETLILMEYLPTRRRFAYVLWAIFVGTWQFPGVAQLVRLLLIGRKHVSTPFAFARWWATLQGRYEGWKAFHSFRKSAQANNGNRNTSNVDV